jgi:hypothetical protein
VSESVDESLRKSIRVRIAAGSLPVLSGSTWAGNACGDHRCVCCHRTIRVTAIEYEPRDHVGLYAHMECFVVWLSESRLLLASGRRPPVRMPPDEPQAELEQAAG